ncbi:MAG TPA: FmdB family zinc ribbon protein [Candidatus Xenobia bacterium]|nr:FmdB family zinc ribbon protein [Candidatus Xenobia bacterium]
MPLYEYECDGCGKRFELLQKFSDPPTVTCTCGGIAHRQLSPPAIQFKGSGWYVTDYARKSAPPEKSEAKSDTKAESAKPEEKKPAASAAND